MKKEKKDKKPLSLSIPDAARSSTTTATTSTFLTAGGNAAVDSFGSLGFLSNLKKDTLPGRGGGGSSERASSPASPTVTSAKSHGGSDSGVEDSLGPAGGGGPLRSLRDLKKRSKLIAEVETAAAAGSSLAAATTAADEVT